MSSNPLITGVEAI